MPQVLSPGVYVQEVPSAVQAIAGVGTSTAAFVGYVANDVPMPARPDGSGNHTVAPAGEPQLISNWAEFKSKFGDINAKNKVLANSVYGFFNNGGTRCWVVRVTDLNVVSSPAPSDPAPSDPAPSDPAPSDPAPSDPTPAPSVSSDQVRKALESFESIDEIAIVAVPLPTQDGGLTVARRNAIRGMALSHCERLQDRFAILDGEETVTGNLTPANIYGGPTSAEGYGAVYFPYIDISGAGEYMPPSGYIAGIYARVDATRGVHKAPANESIRGALGLKYRVGKSQQDGLNPAGINVIRSIGGNATIWGARNIIGANGRAEYRYVNVRRTLNFLRESIDEGTQFVVFEPNTPELWQQINRNVSDFLTTTWRSGALFGTTPAEAFYVKCDAETNPAAVRELGQVVTEVGVAIVRPAEFVELTYLLEVKYASRL